MKKYYSGKNSEKFWKAINSIECMTLYVEGVKLQDQEDKVHKMLIEHLTSPTLTNKERKI